MKKSNKQRALLYFFLGLLIAWGVFRYALNQAVVYSADKSLPELTALALDLGGNPNATDSKGSSALRYAIFRGNEKIVAMLLQHGADVHQRNRFGDLPVDDAIGSSSPVIVELLLDYGVDPNTVLVRNVGISGRTLLMLAVGMQNPHKVRILIRHGADPLKTDPNGRNAFYYAGRNTEVLKELTAAIGREPDPSWLNPVDEEAAAALEERFHRPWHEIVDIEGADQ